LDDTNDSARGIGADGGAVRWGRRGEPVRSAPAVQRLVAAAHPGFSVVTTKDLEPYARQLFIHDHGAACPGLVRLAFFGKGRASLAISLVRGSQGRLVLAEQETQGSWRIRQLDETTGAAVVWAEPPGMSRDVYGEKVLRHSNEGLVWCRLEAWAILYAWVNARVEKIWLTD
jgi:hypothetical protein